jgi:hypothetical protein
MAVNKYVCACNTIGRPVNVEYRESIVAGRVCQHCGNAHTTQVTTQAQMDALLTATVLTHATCAQAQGPGVDGSTMTTRNVGCTGTGGVVRGAVKDVGIY